MGATRKSLSRVHCRDRPFCRCNRTRVGSKGQSEGPFPRPRRRHRRLPASSETPRDCHPLQACTSSRDAVAAPRFPPWFSFVGALPTHFGARGKPRWVGLRPGLIFWLPQGRAHRLDVTRAGSCPPSRRASVYADALPLDRRVGAVPFLCASSGGFPKQPTGHHSEMPPSNHENRHEPRTWKCISECPQCVV